MGDNDTLSAMVAVGIKADVLLLLSDIDGLYDRDPHKHSDARLIQEVHELTEEILALGGDRGSALGTGGMRTKLHAAEICTAEGCDMVIMNGAAPSGLYKWLDGQPIGTRFYAQAKK